MLLWSHFSQVVNQSQGFVDDLDACYSRLAMVGLDYDEGEGKVLIHRNDLKDIANALRKAKRVRIGFEPSGDTLEGMALIIDTEAIRYKFIGANGTFPNYEAIIPTEHTTMAHLDSVEAVKAVASLG